MPQVDHALVTQAEYARHRGCSRESVRKAVATGRISAFGPEQRINVALADTQWAQNTRPRAAPGRASAAAPPPAAATPNGAPAYDVSRARREHAQAQIAEVALQRELGGLLARDEVLHVVADAATTLRARLEALPDQLAHELAGLTDEAAIHARMSGFIEDLLTEMSESFAKAARAATGAEADAYDARRLGLPVLDPALPFDDDDGADLAPAGA